MKAYNWLPKTPDTTGWKERHLDGLAQLHGFHSGIVMLFRGWVAYAEEYQMRYKSPIGEDGVLGPEWAEIGKALRGLLNGECGRLDAGTLDTIILDNLTEMGFGEEG